jgi:hypothetical protein
MVATSLALSLRVAPTDSINAVLQGYPVPQTDAWLIPAQCMNTFSVYNI